MGVEIKKLRKSFGGKPAVDGITLTVPDGKLLTLLGPSGSGKTTLLRCIAGVEDPDGGSISIGSKTVFDFEAGVNVPPEDRGVGMVFQSNALWPHMTVRKNVSYPLEIRNDRDTEQKVRSILALLKIDALAERYPSEISGGEQQRVAIARAMVYNPSLVLLDEPFSSLDAPLREALRDELKQLQLRLKATMLYVTHERVDALSLGDLMAVLSEGKVEAFGTPDDLLRNPPNAYTAKFVGGMLAIEGDAVPTDSGSRVTTAFGNYEVPGSKKVSGRAFLCVPSTACTLEKGGAPGLVPGTVTGTVRRPSGASAVRVSTEAGVVELTVHGGLPETHPGDSVSLRVDPAKCLVLDR